MSKRRTRKFAKSGVEKVCIGAWIPKDVYANIKSRADANSRSFNAELEITLARGVTHPQ